MEDSWLADHEKGDGCLVNCMIGITSQRSLTPTKDRSTPMMPVCAEERIRQDRLKASKAGLHGDTVTRIYTYKR